MIYTHGAAAAGSGAATAGIPEGVTVGLFGPPGKPLVGKPVPSMEGHLLYATIQHGTDGLTVDLLAPGARGANDYGAVSGTDEVGRLAQLSLTKSGRVSRTNLASANSKGMRANPLDGPVLYRDAGTLRETAFMAERTKFHVLTLRKDQKANLSDVFELVTDLKTAGLTYECVQIYACRGSVGSDAVAHSTEINRSTLGPSHDRRRVEADGSLIPAQDAD